MEKFIIGLIFGLSIQPLLDGFTSLVMSFFEMIKSYFAIKIATNDKKITDLSSEVKKNIIGFSAGEGVDDYDI